MFTWEQALREIAFGNPLRRTSWPEQEYVESLMTVELNAEPEIYPYADGHGVRFRIVKLTRADPEIPAEAWGPSKEDETATDWTIA
jgi:hypothetical protein